MKWDTAWDTRPGEEYSSRFKGTPFVQKRGTRSSLQDPSPPPTPVYHFYLPRAAAPVQWRSLAGSGVGALVRAAMCKHTGEEATGRGPALVMDEAVAATSCGCNSNGHTG